MGVWIETPAICNAVNRPFVTPCVGVWIETERGAVHEIAVVVTPCVGVWIETGQVLLQGNGTLSHPAWVCGLKLFGQTSEGFTQVVTPCVGVWIETPEHSALYLRI